MLIRGAFFEKPGGMQARDLPFILYPLDVTPYTEDERTVYEEDEASGTERVAVTRFYITTTLPAEHVLAYIRAHALPLRMDVVADEKVE